MSKFQKHNLSNIQSIFEEKTGTSLQYKRYAYHRPINRAVLVAAMLALCVMLAAFTYPLFSPLDGDALTLSAVYEGNGVVSVQVENHSHKTLKFQPQTKLVKWITGEEVEPVSDAVIFDGTTIAANSTSTMTIDLSKAYDMSALEQTWAREWYYLVLTNDHFVYGQEWKCSVSFGAQMMEKTEGSYSIDPVILSQIEEELRYYFEDDYYGVFAWNPMHYEYLQKVDEYLLRSEKRIVESMYPRLMLEPAPDRVIFDETYPLEKQYQLAFQSYTLRDAFGKLLGSTESECFKVLSVSIPAYEGAQGQSWSLPLMYFATYERSLIESQEDCAFIYGQIVSFGELEPYQVYEDEQFVCYDVTHLIYTDLRAYVEEVVAMDPDYYYFDEQSYQRIENVWNYYHDHENLKMMTWEEYVEFRPDANINEVPDEDILTKSGLYGIVTANRDIEKIVITLETEDGEVIYSGTFVPTDPRYYDLYCAAEASEALCGLEEGVYVLEATAWLDSPIMSCQSLWGQIITVGNAT